MKGEEKKSEASQELERLKSFCLSLQQQLSEKEKGAMEAQLKAEEQIQRATEETHKVFFVRFLLFDYAYCAERMSHERNEYETVRES